MEETKFTPGTVETFKAIIFGIEDSLISTLGVVTGLAAAGQAPGTIIFSGLIVIIVEAVSIGSSEYLSTKIEKEIDQAGIEKMKKKISENPNQVIKDLVAIYRLRGLRDHEIVTIVGRLKQNKNALLKELIYHRLHLPYPLPQKPAKSGAYMALSDFLAGLVPLSPYLVIPSSASGGVLPLAPILSIGLSFIFLFYIGHLKGRIVGRQPVKSGLEIVGVSMLAALTGFLAGQILAILGVDLL